MECPEYWVMRYEALISPEDQEEVWAKESQVGSKKLIEDRVEQYEKEPDKYRAITIFICKEEPSA